MSPALRNRNYLAYFIGNTLSLHGLWVYRVALGWLAWELSGSEFWVGVIAFTQFAPAVLFGPLFGVLADRFDRRAASFLVNTVSTFNMLVLALLTWLGHTDLLVLTLIATMQGILEGAHMPVRMALVPNLVNRDELQSALAANAISFNLSRFVGPALAGLLIAGWGVASAFLFNAVSYLAILAALLVIRLRETTPARVRNGLWQELGDGLRYALAHPRIRLLLALIATGSVLGRGPLELLPAFADDVFSRGSAGLAILTSAGGLGAVVAGLVLSVGSGWLRLRLVAACVFVSGLLLVLLGASTHFWFSTIIIAVLGGLLSLSGVGTQILLQSQIDDDVRGRVSSLWGVTAFGGIALGGLLNGALASVYGLREVTAAAGIGSLLIVIAILARHRRNKESAAAMTDG